MSSFALWVSLFCLTVYQGDGIFEYGTLLNWLGVLPELDDLEHNGGGIGGGYPDKYRFNGKPGPCSDEHAQPLIVPIFPPTVRHGQRNFPQKTDEKDEEEEGDAEGSPVDERPCGREKTRCGNQGSDNKPSVFILP